MRRLGIRYRHLLGWRRFWLLCGLLGLTLLLVLYSGSLASHSHGLSAASGQPDLGGGGGDSRLAYAHAIYHRLGAAVGNFSALAYAGASAEIGAVLIGPAARHFSFAGGYNVSRARLAELLADTMQMMELQRTAQKTLAYMVSIHPDYDANAGSCRCGSISELCHCCARVALRPLRLEQTVCIDFHYQVHSQALRTRIVLGNGAVVVDQLLGASDPPLLCAGGASSLELCARFRNTTYTVTLHSAHKTRLQGCLDLLVNLRNVTVSAYPMGCFEARGHSGRLA